VAGRWVLSDIASTSVQPVRHGQRMRAFLVFCIAGLPGVLVLVLTLPAQLSRMAPGKPLPMPLAVIESIAFAQGYALVVLFALAGTFAAPACGFRSLVYDWATGRPRSGTLRLPVAIVAGAVLLAFGLLVDIALIPYYGPSWNALKALMPDRGTALAVGVLYGGIDEEILTRWGLMSVLAWAGWRLFQRGRAAPSAGVVAVAVVLAALAFGAGHLPVAMKLVHPMPAIVVLRIVLLNAVAGCAFGWLFFRYSLETAMVAHVTFHAGLFAVGSVVT